jgi:hypothetical protein
MAGGAAWNIPDSDLKVLRDLAKRLREIAGLPENLERKKLWYKHDQGDGERPMVLIEILGVDDHEFDDEYNRVECTEEWARGVERELRRTVYQFERIGDDKVIEPFFNCPWLVEKGDYGVRTDYVHGENPEGTRGSYRWEAPIKDLDADFGRLHHRTPSVDREARLAWKAHIEEVIGDILSVRIRDSHWWTMGLTWEAIKLIGLEALMLSMYDNPEGLHRLMAFLRDDHIALAQWCESEGLIALNNGNDYIGSGSTGYTHALPQSDWNEGDPVRLKDTWVLAESQETVGVSPQAFEEFVFPYQESIVDLFGRCYYGCCEPLHTRWEVVKRFPNLKRVSISPWCDQEVMAEALGKDYAFCRKPNPALISTDNFDEEAIREDLRGTLRAARNCNVEIVMKDVHTVRSHPERFGRWVELAREVIGEIW